jgi:hypothetical protein
VFADIDYAGVCRTFKLQDKKTVEIRIRDLRLVIVSHLHDLLDQGFLREEFGDL